MPVTIRTMLALLAGVCAGALLLGPRGAEATTVLDISFDALVAAADVVFDGTVTDVAISSDPSSGKPTKTVTFAVATMLKGSARREISLAFRGLQQADGTMFWVEGSPDFHVGDRDVVFAYVDRDYESPIVGIWQGRMNVVRDGDREMVRTDKSIANPAASGAPQHGANTGAMSLVPLKDLEQAVVRAQENAR